jgi:high-affinity iron transporter
MLPAFLITFREVIEASLIVATILGILVKLNQPKGVRTVWMATGAAALTSFALLVVASLLGLKAQEVYSGRTEEMIEGILMITSAVFITWAVFFLHKYFGQYKAKLLSKIKSTVEQEEQKGLFILAFTAVLREGFEIVLFLSTIYFSSNPQSILTGFAGGIGAGLIVSFAFFAATLRLPVFYAFRVTSVLLILFAGGLLVHGIHEFAEVGWLPEIGKSTFAFIPEKTSFAGQMLQAIFGFTKSMDMIQVASYAAYVSFMGWWVFFRKTVRAETDH